MVFMALALLLLLAVCSPPITPGPIKSSLPMQMTTVLLMLRFIHPTQNTGP